MTFTGETIALPFIIGESEKLTKPKFEFSSKVILVQKYLFELTGTNFLILVFDQLLKASEFFEVNPFIAKISNFGRCDTLILHQLKYLNKFKVLRYS